MQPWEIVDREAAAPGGVELVLARRGDEWVVRAGGQVLMSSRQHGSEEALAELALGRAARRKTVLVGGLGLGFTVRAALDRVPTDARVIVAETSAALVGWNRGPVSGLAGRPLDDPRVRLQQADVRARIGEAKGAFDVILLDVDNGPAALSRTGNRSLYASSGLHACHAALAAGGVLGVWSAGPDEDFQEALERAGFEVEVKIVPARGAAGGKKHAVFLGMKREGGRPRPRNRAPGRRPR